MSGFAQKRLITDVIANLLDGPAWLRRVLIERVIGRGYRLDELMRDDEALEDLIRKTAIGVVVSLTFIREPTHRIRIWDEVGGAPPLVPDQP